jgi:hypothetical protein
VWGKGGGGGKREVMTQSLYAHMNKGNFIKSVFERVVGANGQKY